MDCSPPGSSGHGIFQARVLDWVLSLSLVTKSCQTLATPCTVACQASLSMGFSRQEYWSGLLFPSPGDLPNPGIKLGSPALQADSLLPELKGLGYHSLIWEWHLGLLYCRMILYHLSHQESPYSKGNQPRIFIRNTDAKAETPILWAPAVKNQLIRQYLDPGKVWRQEEKEATEDEMVGCHHWFNGHEFGQTPGGCEGQGSLTCAAHGVMHSQTWLSNWIITTYDNRRSPVQWLNWEAAPNHFPKPSLQQRKAMVTVSWSAASLNHYGSLNLSETIISEKYTQ